MEHNQIIRREFSKQAQGFEQKGLTLSNLEIMDWIVSRLPLEKEFSVLDVAAGTGLLSRALAPHVRDVVAIDITPGMLKYARLETTKNKLENISMQEGNAEELPFASNSFDLVASRLAIHHFETPLIQLREMVRVCKPDRKVAVVDLLAPEEEGVAESYNDLERLRDPSHVKALSQTRMQQMLSDVGLTLDSIETRDVEVDFQRWVQMTGTNPETVQQLQEKLLNDIGGHSKTGMRPFMKDGALKFMQVWSVIIGRKQEPDPKQSSTQAAILSE